MASKTVKTGNYGCSIRIEYNFGVSGRSWWLDARMIFNTGQYNMGPWGSYGSTYLHTTTGNGGLPSTGAGTDYIIINWTRITSGTYDNAGTAPTVSFGWSWGVNSSWANMSYPSGTVSVTGSAAPNITPPTNVSINPVPSRTTINLNRSWQNATACQYNINDWGWINENASYNNGVKVSGNTVSNLTPNTSYKCQIRMNRNGGSYTASSAKTVITTHNAPTIGAQSVSYARASSVLESTYTSTLTYDVVYDYAAYKSRKIDYGATTDYGSSVSDTKSISDLQPNTTYYYKITETDNGGNLTTSSTATGSFTTPGIAPTLSNFDITLGRTEATFNYDVNYDTNASFKSLSIEYGKTSSYGSTSSNNHIVGLEVNTLYYYSLIVTDNYNRTVTKTGSFTTIANPPVFTTESIDGVDIDNAMLNFVAVPDTNVTIVKYALYKIEDDGTEVKVQEKSDGYFEILELNSETLYNYYCIVTDSANRSTRSSTMTFETPASTFVHYMDNNGVDKFVKLVGIGELKNYIRHCKLEVGGIAFAVGRSYTLACNNSTSTTSMRSNLISIEDNATLSKSTACFLQSTLFSWKIYLFDENGNGLRTQSGQIGNATVLPFGNDAKYIAVEIESTDLEKILKSTKLYGCDDGDLIDILDNNKKRKKTITPTDLVKVSKFMRYIDVGASGNSVNKQHNIVELEVYDKDGVNRASGVIPTLAKGDSITGEAFSTDGISTISTNNWTTATGLNTIIRFDLGAVYEISHIKLYRYYADGRKYKKTFVYGRAGDRPEDDLHDGELCYKFHDYKRDGIYEETSNGKVWYIEKEPEDVSKPIINSFTVNTTDWTNQGVILTILAEDNESTDNLIYSFDGGNNWTRRNQITVFKNTTYTAIVKDKKGNVSVTNPTIKVTNVDLIPPSAPVVVMRYNDLNGNEYKGDVWTNKDIYVDCKQGISYNLCQNIVEHGYINKETGLDIADANRTKEVNNMILTGISNKLYVQKYNYESTEIDDGIVTIYFYDKNETYLGYKDVDFTNPFIDVMSGAHHCRIADTSGDLNNYFLVAESNIELPFETYYHVTDNLSGIKGWYYRTDLNSNTYVPLPNNDVINYSLAATIYIVTRDNAGNNSRYLAKDLKIDKEPPRDIRFTYVKEEHTLEITATAIDDLSGIRGYQFSKDGGKTWSNEQESNVYTFTELNGVYDVMVRVIDMASNYANSEFQVIAVGDTSKYPSITGVDGNPTDWTNQNVTLSINGDVGTHAESGATIVKYSFDNGKTWSTNKTAIFEDNQMVYIRIEDSAGYKSDTFIVEINKIDKVPPTLNLPITIAQIPVGTSIDLWDGVTYSDNDSGIDETKKKTVPTDSALLSLGEQTIEYTVEDNAGNKTTKIRTVMILGSVPADTLYPRDDLYPENLSLSNTDLASYTHRELSQYKLSEIRGGSI